MVKNVTRIIVALVLAAIAFGQLYDTLMRIIENQLHADADVPPVTQRIM